MGVVKVEEVGEASLREIVRYEDIVKPAWEIYRYGEAGMGEIWRYGDMVKTAWERY